MYFYVAKNGIKNHGGYYLSLRGCVLSQSAINQYEIQIKYKKSLTDIGTVYDGSIINFTLIVSLDGNVYYNLHSWKSVSNWFYLQCNGFLRRHNCFLEDVVSVPSGTVLSYRTVKQNPVHDWEKEGF